MTNQTQDYPAKHVTVEVQGGKVIKVDPEKLVCDEACYIVWQLTVGSGSRSRIAIKDNDSDEFELVTNPDPTTIRVLNLCTKKGSYRYRILESQGLPYDPTIDNKPK